MKDLLSGIKVRVIADTYNLSQSVIYRIKNKK
jgi:transposase